MYYSLDILGQKFNRLTAIEKTNERQGNGIMWLFKCDCGKTVKVRGTSVTTGHTQSCGCLHKERASEAGKMKRTHGMTGTKEYGTWCKCISKCHNPKDPDWPNYGGRGIKMDADWAESFQAFYAHMGNAPTTKHSIHRVNNDGNYEPSNCVWATNYVQCRARRNSHIITFEGQSMNITDWERKLKIPRTTILRRLRRGWSTKDALLTP